MAFVLLSYDKFVWFVLSTKSFQHIYNYKSISIFASWNVSLSMKFCQKCDSFIQSVCVYVWLFFGNDDQVNIDTQKAVTTAQFVVTIFSSDYVIYLNSNYGCDFEFFWFWWREFSIMDTNFGWSFHLCLHIMDNPRSIRMYAIRLWFYNQRYIQFEKQRSHRSHEEITWYHLQYIVDWSRW